MAGSMIALLVDDAKHTRCGSLAKDGYRLESWIQSVPWETWADGQLLTEHAVVLNPSITTMPHAFLISRWESANISCATGSEVRTAT